MLNSIIYITFKRGGANVMNIFYILTHGDDRKKTKSRIAYYAIKENVAARMSMYALQRT